MIGEPAAALGAVGRHPHAAILCEQSQVGGDNAGTAVKGSIVDVGNLVKVGAGTMTVYGNDTYSGSTTVASGGAFQSGMRTGCQATQLIEPRSTP